MNCNQVFNILTRGPFPSGESTDASVEIHLATCAGCRRLAEALRPALEVFQEAVGPEECGGLPGYWGELAPTAGETTVTTAPRRARQNIWSAQHIAEVLAEQANQTLLWRIGTALLVVGMILGACLHSLLSMQPPAEQPVAPVVGRGDERAPMNNAQSTHSPNSSSSNRSAR